MSQINPKSGKWGCFVTVFFLLCCMFTGCKTTVTVRKSPAYVAAEGTSASSCVVASNNHCQLIWDNDYKGIFLVDKKANHIWSSIPYSYYQMGDYSGVAGVRLNSALFLEYYDTEAMQLKTGYSSVEAEENGRIVASVENGVLTVVYDFADLSISIPVQYSLSDNGLKARILVSQIRESQNVVCSISLLPFMASVKATDTLDSYLVIPSGSGALMYVDEGKRQKRSISQPVYGTDYAVNMVEQYTTEEEVRLPLFGVKDDGAALCGIITEGAELASVCAQAGDDEIGYASVYVSFKLRGMDTAYVPGLTGYKEAVTKYTDDMVLKDALEVQYIPLSGSQATYAGMAAYYRETLFSKTKIKNEKPLYLQFYGAAQVKKSFFGIPYTALMPVTPLSAVKDTLEEILGDTGEAPKVQLLGYGASGLDAGKIAGGYTLSSAVGGMKGYRKLLSYSEEKQIQIYMDFDVLYFRNSGQGINKWTGIAHTANGLNAARHFYSVSTPAIAQGSYTYYMVRRDNLNAVVNRLLKKSEGITGISLNTLGSMSYSDYRHQDMYLKAGFDKQAAQLLDMVSDSHPIAVSNPNSYALVHSDDVFGIPVCSAGFDGFDEDIPLYGMVVKGYVPFSVSAINLANNTQEQFLKAAEVGAGLCFALSDQWDMRFLTSFHSALNGTLTKSWLDTIKQMMLEYNDFFQSARGASIVAHTHLADGVSKTVFDNGVTVVVNFTDTSYGTVDAKSYQHGSVKLT